MAFRGDIPILVLAILDREPMHGYQIARLLKESRAASKMTEGQIYPHLHKLEENGLVKAEWDLETGGAPKRIYRLTDAGSVELSKQRKVWEEFVAGVNQLVQKNIRAEVPNA